MGPVRHATSVATTAIRRMRRLLRGDPLRSAHFGPGSRSFGMAMAVTGAPGKHRRGRGLVSPARGRACVSFFQVTGSSAPGAVYRSARALLAINPEKRSSQGSARGRVAAAAVPAEFPHPPHAQGRCNTGHEHHLRGLGDDDQVAAGIERVDPIRVTAVDI